MAAPWAPLAWVSGEEITNSHNAFPVLKNSTFSGHISHAYLIPDSKEINLSASSP